MTWSRRGRLPESRGVDVNEPTDIPLGLPGVRGSARGGYTLIEMMTVVVILGVLAVLFFLGLQWAIEAARVAAFRANMDTFTRAAELYRVRHGTYPPDTPPGQLPSGGFEHYINKEKWLRQTPFGGHWSIATGDTYTSIGVSFAGEITEDEEDVLQRVYLKGVLSYDRAYDDGNLETGNFRTDGSGFYYQALAH